MRIFMLPNGKETVVRMVFNAVLFDFHGALVLSREMLELLIMRFQKKSFPDLKVLIGESKEV